MPSAHSLWHRWPNRKIFQRHLVLEGVLRVLQEDLPALLLAVVRVAAASSGTAVIREAAVKFGAPTHVVGGGVGGRNVPSIVIRVHIGGRNVRSVHCALCPFEHLVIDERTNGAGAQRSCHHCFWFRVQPVLMCVKEARLSGF